MESITGNTFYFDFEVRLMEMLQGALGEKGALLISHFSALGEILFFLLVFGIFYWGIDKKTGIRMGTFLMFGLCANPMVKNVAFRRRPYFDNPSIKCFRPVEKGADIYDIAAQGFSFPSGHSTNSVCVYGGVAVCRKEKALKVIGILFPILIGLSRVVVGVHYPTDILVGWLMGIALIVVLSFVLDKAGDEKRWMVFLCLFIIGVIGACYCVTDDFFTGFGVMSGFLLGAEIEERFIKFEDSKKLPEALIRIFFGMVIFGGLTVVLKYPFPEQLRERGDIISQLIRIIRYGMASFVAVGIYPLCFKKLSKLFDR